MLNIWPRIDYSKSSFLDKNLGMALEISFLRAVIKILILIVFILLASGVYFQNKAASNLDHQRILMVPAINRKIVIPADSYISETYIKAVSNTVVRLNETWNYEDYENSIEELCRDYYMREQCELLRANLKSTKRIDYVKQNKMFSLFKIDEDKSEYRFCKELKRPCSIVVGKRTLFFNNNDKIAEKEVAYLLIGENVWPDENNPYALRISRLKINEEDDPKSKLLPQLELAMKGDKSVLK
jgi:hypothetical protein